MLQTEVMFHYQIYNLKDKVSLKKNMFGFGFL
jgi:hypothetical protein